MLLAFATLAAHASPPPSASPALAPWFQSLRDPVSGVSCCAEVDGHILSDDDWRTTNNGYQVRIKGEWLDVPPSRVLDRTDNPTGGAVVFYERSRWLEHPPVICFIRPADT